MPIRLALLTLVGCLAACRAEENAAIDRPPQTNETVRKTQTTAPDSIAPIDFADIVAAEGDAAEVIAAAIKAHGADKVADVKAGEILHLTRGFLAPQLYDEISTVSTFQVPNHLHEFTKHGTSKSSIITERTYIRNGNQAWEKEGNESFASVRQLRLIEDAFPLRFAHDLLTLRDSGLSLETVGQIDLDDQMLLIIRASREGETLAHFYFDESTALIARLSTKTYVVKKGRVGLSETLYSDYRPIGDMMLPGTLRVYHDSEIFMETTLESFKVLNEASSELFIPKE